MNRLTRYFLKLFAIDSTALFVMATCLIFLGQCLRLMDATALRGRAFGVLISQAALAMPSVVPYYLFVLVAVSMARVLRGLQASRELHAVHAGRRFGALGIAIALYTLITAVIALGLAHFVAPASLHEASVLKARIAADLVRSSLVPNRFAEMGDGVTITVGGRKPNGEITSFFADDHRTPEMRRTYMAKSALLTADERGYVLQLEEGTIQYRSADNQFSEISFSRYDMVLDQLVGAADTVERRSEISSPRLVEQTATDGWTKEIVGELVKRNVEGLRVIALCLFVAAMGAFPSGRRRNPLLPIEIVVVLLAVLERSISTYVPDKGPFGAYAPVVGTVLLLALGLGILVVKLRLFLPLPRIPRSA